MAHSVGTVIALLAVVQFLSFLCATIDIRAIATKRYVWAVVTNASIPMLNYAVILLATEGHTGLLGALAVAFGGAASAVVGIWLTSHWTE